MPMNMSQADLSAAEVGLGKHLCPFLYVCSSPSSAVLQINNLYKYLVVVFNNIDYN